MMMTTYLLSLLLATGSVGQTNLAAVVQSIDGTVYQADVASIAAPDSLLCYGKDGTDTKVAWEDIDVVRVGKSPAPKAHGAWVVLLHTGDRILGEIVGGDTKRLHLKHAILGELDIALTEISRVQRVAAAVTTEPMAGEEDLLQLTNGDFLRGAVAGCGSSGLAFFDGKRDREFRWAGIAGLQLAALSRRPGSGLRWIVTLTDGTSLVGTAFQNESGSLSIKTVLDRKMSAPIDQLVSVEPIGGRRTWLSMMEPAEYKATPYFDIRWGFERDRNVVGGPLCVASETYARGIGLHSACRISYALDKRFRRFRAAVALDDTAGPLGDADVRILIDGRLLVELEHVRKNEALRLVDVNVSGGETLTIEIGFGDRGDVQDRVNLLNAALIEK
ncbi:hypothetical protein B7486_03725 [cyanobacterium TDX16]|nr:hypothetical protein B7486_03725 [cyanobacterium TDX16]